MGRERIRLYVNILLAVLVFGSWLGMFFFGTGSLVQNGFGSLRYFTLLSNLFVGFVAIAWLVNSGKGKGGDGRASVRVERLKYIAAASVGLTFATVLFFLGPIYGYPEMFKGFNLPLHLIIPVIAILEVIFLTDTPFTRRDNRLVIIPPLMYGICYLVNILVNGIGEWPDTNDWYFFFHWGYPVGVLIYVILTAVTWSIGFAMRKLQRAGSVYEAKEKRS